MRKKLAIYLFSFTALFFLNIFLILNLAKQSDRQTAIEKILSEIEDSNSLAKQFNFSSAPFKIDSIATEAKVSDARVANLKAFFRKHNSPLYDYAEVIVRESDKNGFDYRLLPAIAMQESTLCRSIPANSYNCWGWGVYGDQVIRFSSYDEAIRTVAEGIKADYLDKGLITATKIMERYTPSSPNGSWARSVNHFLRLLE